MPVIGESYPIADLRIVRVLLESWSNCNLVPVIGYHTVLINLDLVTLKFVGIWSLSISSDYPVHLGGKGLNVLHRGVDAKSRVKLQVTYFLAHQPAVGLEKIYVHVLFGTSFKAKNFFGGVVSWDFSGVLEPLLTIPLNITYDSWEFLNILL